jgi:hypothetical protein
MTYLERLYILRKREQEHLSTVDFQLFIWKFDQLIEKVKQQG